MPSRSQSSKSTRNPKARPAGTRGYDASSAAAFGEVVRWARQNAGISQEALAYMSDVERAYMGRLERGQNQPTLFVILKIANALGYRSSELMALVEQRLLV